MRRPDIVIHRVPLRRRRPHRVRRRPLLREMHDRVRPQLRQHPRQPVILGRQIQVHEPDLPPGHLPPDTDPLPDRPDRRQRLHLKINIDLPAAQVIQDSDVMTAIRQVQAGRPPAEPIAAKNQNPHPDSHQIRQSKKQPATTARRPGSAQYSGAGKGSASALASRSPGSLPAGPRCCLAMLTTGRIKGALLNKSGRPGRSICRRLATSWRADRPDSLVQRGLRVKFW